MPKSLSSPLTSLKHRRDSKKKTKKIPKFTANSYIIIHPCYIILLPQTTSNLQTSHKIHIHHSQFNSSNYALPQSYSFNHLIPKTKSSSIHLTQYSTNKNTFSTYPTSVSISPLFQEHCYLS
jgi:hypothetical protein